MVVRLCAWQKEREHLSGATNGDQFRSLLIPDEPAKVYHSFLRSQLVTVHAGTKPALQAGALGGTGIEAIALVARTFQSQCHALRKL